jgi:hypothetical protein
MSTRETRPAAALYAHIIAIIILLVLVIGLCFTGLGSSIGPEGTRVLVFGGLSGVGGLGYLFLCTRWATSTGIRALVCWQVALHIFEPVLSTAVTVSLSPSAQELHRGLLAKDTSGVAGNVALVDLGLYLVAWIGIIALWRPADFIYLAAVALELLIAVAWGNGSAATPEYGIAIAASNLNLIVTGTILMMVFVVRQTPLVRPESIVSSSA